ncbi:hypothetical protein NDU88_007993, partial [Pleurodeles waltl]
LCSYQFARFSLAAHAAAILQTGFCPPAARSDQAQEGRTRMSFGRGRQHPLPFGNRCDWLGR